MKDKKVITLDLTGCKNGDDLHRRIKEAFDFPDYYGENWDAFWDLLWSYTPVDEVIVKGEHTLSDDFKWDIRTMHEVLQRMKDEEEESRNTIENYNHTFDFQILD